MQEHVTEPPPGPTVDRPRAEPVAGVPSDHRSVSGLLEALAGEGFEADFRPAEQPGDLWCDVCDTASSVGTLRNLREHRLEGASDPDDMVLVVAGHCPSCGTGGTVVLGFGPNASAVDSDLVAALPR